MDNTRNINNKLWCINRNLESDFTNDYGLSTVTSQEQIKVEKNIDMHYSVLGLVDADEGVVKLSRSKHINFLKGGLRNLSSKLSCLDASRPWMIYWSVHALHLLGVELEPELKDDIIDFLSRCQCEDGGFGGGPGQLAHLAPTYGAVNALVTIGTEKAYSVINRQTLANFLGRMVTPEGSFRMHEGGEVDIRGAYCAVSVAKLVKLQLKPLFSNTPRWIIQCQTYEGGFSGGPGLEAHGGYTFCGMAALALLHSEHLADTQSLLRWVASRQMKFSGGFQGRTNKLVDGCYSFWQGGLFAILHKIMTQEGPEPSCPDDEQTWLFHCEALQNYLLICCQHQKGGLIDKPGLHPDMYHTCYTLSGLSVAQHFCYSNIHNINVVGHPSNQLLITHPLYNVGMSAVVAASKYFIDQPVVGPAGDSGNIEASIQEGLRLDGNQSSPAKNNNVSSNND